MPRFFPRPVRWLEQKLEPLELAVTVGLWIVIAITVIVLIQPSKTIKAAWLTWIMLP